MAYDAALADRIRAVVANWEGVTHKRMFGGICFLLFGHMCCGVLKEDLILRLSQEHTVEALKRPHTRPFDIAPTPMKTIFFVGPEGFRTDEALRGWLEQSYQFALSLPPKPARGRP